jgi:hypothetical protein
MSLTISAELEQRVLNTARKRGVAPDDLIQEVLLRETRDETEPSKLQLTVDEFLAELNRIGKNLPKLSDYAYTREAFYEDHD